MRAIEMKVLRARTLCLVIAGFLVSGATPPAASPPRTVRTGPDLVPITDSGRVLHFQERNERRFAFWVRNAGNAPAAQNRIRLKVYHRKWPDDPWTLHADVVLDVWPLQPGEESRALVSRLIYKRNLRNRHMDATIYRWEFLVDNSQQVSETNEANNSHTNSGFYNRADLMETGVSGKFH